MCVDPSQLWKLDNTTGVLENKENVWKSNHEWEILKPKKTQMNQDWNLFNIKNNSRKEETESDIKKDISGNPEETFLRYKLNQGSEVSFSKDPGIEKLDLWKKGKPNVDGYFTLETSNGAKVLTATSKDGLEIEGNFDLLKTVN